jgi:dTDP-4-amino-4,6-dideoxygalactose transaminase
LYIIRLKNSNKHKQVFKYLRKSGIGVNLHYIPVHTQPYYQQTCVNFTDLKQAEQYYKDAISLPLYPTMTEQQQDIVISSLHKALQL